MVLGKDTYWSLYLASMEHEQDRKTPNCPDHECKGYNAADYYSQKTYYGRTNRLSFRLSMTIVRLVKN